MSTPPTHTPPAPCLASPPIVYTFLATLILLLGVSSAIVFRSLLLRRRHRRMIAEAIANGTWVPPTPRVRVDLRKKPRLWDAWVAPPVLGGGAGEKDEWDGIMVGVVFLVFLGKASFSSSSPPLASIPLLCHRPSPFSPSLLRLCPVGSPLLPFLRLPIRPTSPPSLLFLFTNHHICGPYSFIPPSPSSRFLPHVSHRTCRILSACP
ncbi:hypothetical protein B0H19DRAFT_1097657 [Mycena capillaripes]|nr:hypothetical protein B0H19DRAFT_1097657 [Mycena capillaripes]